MIKLYTIGCPKCLVLERKLKDAGIEYETVNDTDTIISKGITTLPFVEIDDKIMTFEEIINWLKQKK